MTKSFFLPLICFLIFSCTPQTEKTAKAKPQLDPKILINCEGIGEVKLSYSHADLKSKFGDAISEHENNIRGKYTSLWERSPKHINVYWKENDAPFKTIKYIEAVDPMAPYMTKDSIGIGMSLRELVNKNGNMPITFNNFYTTTEPGLIKGFNNGEIPKSNPCLEGTLETTDQRPIDVLEMRAFEKVQEVKSFDRILQRMDVVLNSVRLTLKK
ncbi:MAG TPA: hypothetical protein VF602_13570 [Pedobacter sp.]